VTDIDTRLRAARGLGKDETKASVEAFESLRRRGGIRKPRLLSPLTGGEASPRP